MTSDDESPDSPDAAAASDAANGTDWGCGKEHAESPIRGYFAVDAPARPVKNGRPLLAPAASGAVEPEIQTSAGISHSRTSAPGCFALALDLYASKPSSEGIVKLYMPRKCSGPKKYPSFSPIYLASPAVHSNSIPYAYMPSDRSS